MTQLGNTKIIFEQFNTIHDQYHDTLTDDKAIEDSDDYYDITEQAYIKAVTEANIWLGKSPPSQTSASSINSCSNTSSSINSGSTSSLSDLCTFMSMPVLTLPVFSGNVLDYNSFMAFLYSAH